MKRLMILWFKWQISRTSRKVMSQKYSADEIRAILRGYWLRFKKLRPELPKQSTMGGQLMVDLAGMSNAFYREMKARGLNEEEIPKLFYDIAWIIYRKMGGFSWRLAGWGARNDYQRLLKATRLFRKFPFNSPSYRWQDIETADNIVGFDCEKCPVAEYFMSNGLGRFCSKTWCEMDYPLAKMWNAKLERTETISTGSNKCNFRWISNVIPE